MHYLARCLVAILLGLACGVAAAAPTRGPLVSTAWLAENLGRDDVAILELRTALAGQGRGAYLAGHVPGSVWQDYPGAWRTDRGDADGVMPAVDKLEAHLASLGVSNDKRVVLVPAGSGYHEFAAAARIYWTLKALGHDAVSILDGGFAAWAGEGRPLATGEVVPEGDLFVAEPRPALRITTGTVQAKLAGRPILVDARPQSFFRGKEKAPRARLYGRLPGAVHLDGAAFYDAVANRLKPPDELGRIAAAALEHVPRKWTPLSRKDHAREIDPEAVSHPSGDSPRSEAASGGATRDSEIVAYCNSGHWSATTWFVLSEILGYRNVRLYDESMVGWTHDPSRPVESDRIRFDDLRAWWRGGD